MKRLNLFDVVLAAVFVVALLFWIAGMSNLYGQTYSPAPLPKMQFFDADGDPLSAGKVYSYQAGTTTPANTFSDTSGTTNGGAECTIVATCAPLDSAGRATIYLLDSTCYKFVVTDEDDVTVFTQDQICSRASFAAPSFTTATVSSADGLTVNGVIVPQVLEVTFHGQAAAAMVDQSFFVANAAYQVTAVRFAHAVAESTAGTLTVQVTKDTSTEAPGAGDDLLQSTGFNAKSTANTVQTGTLTATTADLQLAAGDRLSVDFSASATELVGVSITVSLKRI